MRGDENASQALRDGAQQRELRRKARRDFGLVAFGLAILPALAVIYYSHRIDFGATMFAATFAAFWLIAILAFR